MSGHFLQSKEWEEFQKSLGREVFRVNGISSIKLPLAFGKSYLYSGGFSNFQYSNFQTLAKRHNVVFVKVESMAEDKEVGDELLAAGFVKSKKEIQPQRTIILDLTKNESELFANMHPKTRYNVRVAEKQGIKFQNSNPQTLERFWELIQKTARRDKFSTHTQKYYEKLLAVPFTKLFVVEYQGKIIAANIVLFYGERATYLHGASDYEYRNLMAPYFLHWETIKYAKEHGYKEYDLWGIDEKRWSGLTRFKRGFGGRELQYIGSYDFVFEPLWYRIYSLRNKIK